MLVMQVVGIYYSAKWIVKLTDGISWHTKSMLVMHVVGITFSAKWIVKLTDRIS